MPWLNKRFVDDIASEIDSMRSNNDPNVKIVVNAYDHAITDNASFRVRGRGEQIFLDVPEDCNGVMRVIATSRITAWDKKFDEATDAVERDVARRGSRRAKKVHAKFASN